MATTQTYGLETAKGGWGDWVGKKLSADCSLTLLLAIKTAGTIFRAYLFDLLALLRMLYG